MALCIFYLDRLMRENSACAGTTFLVGWRELRSAFGI